MTNADNSETECRIEARPWESMVLPIIKKCRLAVSLNMNTAFNEDGSIALADLLETMARTLDDEHLTRELHNSVAGASDEG